jgi:hypothetical protein
MDIKLQQRLAQAWRSREAAEEINYAPATEKELIDFEREFGPIPPNFRWFLRECGGGAVGSEWIDGIVQLPSTHRKFLSECGPSGWTMTDVFVIGWDKGGNPLGIHIPTGRLLVEDHDFGGIHEVFPSIAEFLAAGILPD